MFCPNCGEKIPDGSKFCGRCGRRLTAAPTPPPVPPKPPVPPVPPKPPVPGVETPKRKLDPRLIIALAAALVVGIAGFFIIRAVLSVVSGGNAYAYLSDGTYELITNLREDDIIEIASSRSEAELGGLVSFSPDGKYLYYYTRYDTSGGTGSLCRVEYGRLGKNAERNSEYTEVIATNVTLGFYFLGDGSVVYRTGEGGLYRYDGREETRIAREVAFLLPEREQGAERLLYGVYDDGGYSLYGVTLSDMDEPVRLASGISYVYASPEETGFDNILFAKYEDDGTETLYATGFRREPEKLAEQCSYVMDAGSKHYFLARNSEGLSLYDYVTDSYASSDAALSEPDQEDYSVPRYSYRMIYGTDLSESSYTDLYTSCTQMLYWYGESTWWSYSMEDAVESDWGEDFEAIRAATEDFIEKYADTANEDGYIPVTAEVKADLQNINRLDSSVEDWAWLWLCYERYQDGSTTDYDAYNAAYEAWYDAEDRIALREELRDPENDWPVYTLYCYENGKLTALGDNVLTTRNFSGGVLYSTADMITATLAIEDLSYASDVFAVFDLDYGAENHVLLSDGTTCRMSAEAADTFAAAYDGDYAELYFAGKTVYMSEGNGALSTAPINGGVVGSFTIVTDDAAPLSVDDDALYCAHGSYESADITYCDLYVYRDGTATRLAQDVQQYNAALYADGTVLAYTGYRSGRGYELTMIDAQGEATLVAEDVTQYIRVNGSTLLYLSGGDLYCYNGREKERVRSGVDIFWSKNQMDITWASYNIGYYDHYGY